MLVGGGRTATYGESSNVVGGGGGGGGGGGYVNFSKGKDKGLFVVQTRYATLVKETDMSFSLINPSSRSRLNLVCKRRLIDLNALDDLAVLILDEADCLFELGFEAEIPKLVMLNS
ncbi:hypothetical protein L1887_38926 [Cichorium endivia]|nr:hypothetical protein L1887_38926 [Cichorium endivia]